MKLTAEQTEDLPFPIGCEYIITLSSLLNICRSNVAVAKCHENDGSPGRNASIYRSFDSATSSLFSLSLLDGTQVSFGTTFQKYQATSRRY